MKKNIGVKAFLKTMGLQKNLKTKQLDNRLLISLDDEGKTKLEEVWEQKYYGFASMLDLYSIPKTLKQACLLFSHDYSRIEKSMEWTTQKVLLLKSESILEMGCGFGLLIKFLQTKDPNLRLAGIDQASNLVSIGTELTGIDLIAGNYLELKPNSSYDTIISDFGFDLEDIKLPDSEHEIVEIGDVSICINCCRDFKEKFTPYIKSWRKWGNKNSNLIMTGRLTRNHSYILATLEVANEYNWNLDMSQTKILQTYNKHTKQAEEFPGFVFNSNNENKVRDNFQKVIHMMQH